MIDVDDFKQINDQHGHASGDQVLISLAEMMQQSLPEQSVAARWGGEEFLLLIVNQDTEQATRLAEQLITRVAQQSLSLTGIEVTISAGMCAARAATNPDQWLHLADLALYDSKHHGKNRLTVR
jgi:diguanylate cyclase (GGDEF)-like protein